MGKRLPRIGPLNSWWDLNRDKFSVRTVRPQRGETYAQAVDRFLEEMPRKPTKFLAMVKEQERVRLAKARVAAKKAKGRERYERRMARA